MNKTNRATFRLLRARIQKALTQHWFIERTYVKRYLARKKHKSKPLLAGLGHILYDPKTRETGFLQHNFSGNYRSVRVAGTFPRATTAGLVLLKNYSRIGTGVVGQVAACDRCVSGLRAVYLIPELFQSKKLARVLKGSRICGCIDKYIVSTCPPKPIQKTDFSLITQAYAEPQIANWLLGDDGLENFTQRLLGNPPIPFNWAGIHVRDLIPVLHEEFPYHHRLVTTCRLIFFFLGETHVTRLLEDLFPNFKWEKKFGYKENTEEELIDQYTQPEQAMVIDAPDGTTTTITTRLTIGGQNHNWTLAPEMPTDDREEIPDDGGLDF